MGDPHAGVVVLVGMFLIGLVFLYVWSIIWSYYDAKARGKSGLLVALLVALLSWPMGWVAWLVFRPNERLKDRPPVAGY